MQGFEGPKGLYRALNIHSLSAVSISRDLFVPFSSLQVGVNQRSTYVGLDSCSACADGAGISMQLGTRVFSLAKRLDRKF